MRGGGGHAAALEAGSKLRMKADYSHEDLTEAGRRLRDQVSPFLDFCRGIVDRADEDG